MNKVGYFEGSNYRNLKIEYLDCFKIFYKIQLKIFLNPDVEESKDETGHRGFQISFSFYILWSVFD